MSLFIFSSRDPNYFHLFKNRGSKNTFDENKSKKRNCSKKKKVIAEGNLDTNVYLFLAS